MFWLPNEIRKLSYKFGRKILRPLMIRMFWLPNEVRKFSYKWGRKFYVYVLIKIYWLPNEVRKLLFRFARKSYYLSMQVFYFFYKYFHLVKSVVVSKTNYCISSVIIFSTHQGRQLYFKTKPLLLKPYYFASYQWRKRTQSKRIKKTS